jgi:hypothetical protein
LQIKRSIRDSLGYVGGTAHALDVIGQAAEAVARYYGNNEVGNALASMGSCSEATTIGAYKQAFINWAERHPEQWNSHMGYGVTIALQQSWPCDNEQTTR